MRFPVLVSVGLCFLGLLCEAADEQGRYSLSPPAAPLPSRIVVADTATETERWAASRLAELLMLPTHNDIGMAGTSQIAVGHGAATALGVPTGALADLGDDAFLVSTAHGVPRGSVAITSSAHSARGSVHGAFTFLRALGFEFFAENATRVPSPLPAL